MKVFVAVRKGPEGFEGVEGELVRPALQCVDRLCDCGESFVGMASGHLTRYAEVSSLPHVGRAPYRSIFFESIMRDEGLERSNENQRWAMEWAERVLAAADPLEVGTTVAYDGKRIREAAAR